MNIPYKHIFFDLDHTIWDFYTNCTVTLEELYDLHRLEHLGFSKNDFTQTYIRINDDMWRGFHRGTISKEQIRSNRFEMTFSALGHEKSRIPQGIDRQFLEICPARGGVFPYTHDVLRYLKQKHYSLHIITNGFRETQHIKISTSGLSEYFTHVIEADICGFQKPDKKIFDYALNKSQATAEESIMIGDDLEADIIGARNAGMAQIFINRNGHRHDEKITHEIDCLSKLMGIL